MTLQVFPESFQHDLARESWALYALGVIVIGLRQYARVRKMGFRHLDIDDYLMYLAFIWFTLLIITLNLTAEGGGSALAMPGEDVNALPADVIKVREKGAKIDLVAEQAMLNVIWTLKVCMLLLYNRLTMGLRQHIAVKAISIYVAVGYVACQLAYFCECIPFSQYWQVAPSPSTNCMVLFDYAIVQGTFNISSDVFMLMIPLPLILTVSVPLKQKVILFVIFSMGIFVIVAAALTKAEFFISIYSSDYMFWYTREASVAVYVANLPCIWPLLRDALPVLKSWTPGFVSSGLYKRRNTGGSTNPATGGRTHRTNKSTFMSRHSMEEFQKIMEGTNASSMSKSVVESHNRELNSYSQRSRIEAGDGSSDSGSDEIELQGRIRAHTTIEMSVIEPSEPFYTQSEPRPHTTDGRYKWDLESGRRAKI